MDSLHTEEGQHVHYDALRPLALDVVSVQSMVVYGRVGNNVAWPVLQRAGLEAAIVPTVLFSNTPHYASIHGGAIPDDWFAGYLADLEARGALDVLRAVLVGYLGCPSQARMLAHWLPALKEQHPELQIVIDPVMGDHDSGIYVADGMVDAYRHQLLPVATGMTPNGFELACLTQMPVNTLRETVAAARTLLGEGTEWVVVTSAAQADCAPDELQVVIVTHEGTESFRHQRIDSTVKGTGDLFSATLTARLLAGMSLHNAARVAADTVVQALERTRDAESGELLLGG